MATITLNIPDAALPRVVDALCARAHWSPDLGVAKGPFAKAALAQWLREETLRYELSVAQAAAVAAVAQPPAVDIT
jgi:hypothetical protein